MKFQTFKSGSKGNCYLLTTEKAKILIDIGIPLAELEENLLSAKIRPHKIDAVFITHEHSDHISGLEAFCKKYDKQVFVHKNGFLTLAKKMYYANHKMTHFEGGFDFLDLHVESLQFSHDSVYCCGYKFSDGKHTVATATDLGTAGRGLVDFVRGCDLVLLESNHDEQMLATGSYPPLLKRRVASVRGHLSNNQAGKLAVDMYHAGVKKLLLGHISQNNNIPELAFYTVVQHLKQNGITEGRDIRVDVVTQDKKSEVYNFG